METAAIYLVAAFAAGGLALLVKLPPLVGFLITGFGLHAAGVEEMPGLQTLADLGVTLLLFGIGLKLDVRSLLKARVWLTSLAHMAFSVLLGLAVLLAVAPFGFALLADADLAEMAIVALALSFSSTVFVVKVLDERRDNQTLYGRIAIGVLIMQDIIAVVVLTVSKGKVPSPWALALVLLVPGAWLARKIWDRIDSVELSALFGLMMALVPGYVLFDLVGLKGDLGALIIGALLAGHRRAGELARLLLTGKEVLLIAFFVSIGLTGTPTWEALGLAALLVLLIPVKAVAFFALLRLMRLRYRTATLASLALGNYSEFALIVATVVAATGAVSEDWVVVLALAVALSFLVSAVLNRVAPGLEAWVSRRLPAQDSASLSPEDRPIDLGDADALVLGMGRVGQATVEQLHAVHGRRAVGVEHDSHRAAQLRERGFDVVEADATDVDFWARVKRSGRVELVVLAMPFHGENLLVLDLLRKKGFTGRVAAIAQRNEELDELRSRGADAVFNLYAGAGVNLADHAVESASAPD
ncbi:cation:proton antiporter [Prauserella halophila]|uniref:Cation:proton antiporter n=1 Tax=Prauserella halophila TaxID=185641 RepID=A0ABP4GFV6_9PSEU|nr:cation:proton antiporter family protein [Prauserella halophila]MCP2234482.1 putative Kef-type K+ transport protein, K+/H+ antiporter domain [Prauserella halophila]